jgi:YidC/Oxa1 family membrane protein insertase
MVKKNLLRFEGTEIIQNAQWLAIKSRYPLFLTRTDKPADVFISKEGNRFTGGFIFSDYTLRQNFPEEINFSFYAGPADYFVAKEEIDEPVFGSGFFVSMGRILFTGLSWIHRVIPNWGWTIVIFTLIIKLIFFPLSRKSLSSMKQMQKLRPYLSEIQKKYKDNPQQMQKELMNLYREYKINPFGGCIPMLIQIPIFIGFFIALRSSVFLRGAPFMLWIRDLSTPDTIFRIGEFPINLLPLLMAATSFFQQKLTPQEPSQKALTYMMPIMFLFLFYNFSAGLLLYWITMNIAGLVEQYFIHKK